MTITNISPTQQGLKSVAVGKRGSKPISAELVEQIIAEWRNDATPEIVKGAFLGALFIKGPTTDEKGFEQFLGPETLNRPDLLVSTLCNDAPDDIQSICIRLLNKEELDDATAERIGDFLFDNTEGDGARGLITNILRVRYTNSDEYTGLLRSMAKTFSKTFLEKPPDGKPIISIAEPFDGVDHSNLITPLLADELQTKGYRVVSQVGRNSGPKYGNNLLDLANRLNGTFLKNSSELNGSTPQFGWYLNQATLSPTIDRWVEYRRLLIKRPFLSTLERFVNPFQANIIIASAFHPPYGEKMLDICERAGFPGIIIVRNGLEGTIAFPLKRNTKLHCSTKQPDGSYQRTVIEISPKDIRIKDIPVEEKLTNPSLDKNTELINQYAKGHKTEYNLFDLRVKLTQYGIDKAINWINQKGASLEN